MEKHKQLLETLWGQYATMTPSAPAIQKIFLDRGEQVYNDHIAIRTFCDPRVNIDVMARPFIDAGYEAAGEYEFPEKKLFARHFEHATDKQAPKVFISELKLQECSPMLQEVIDSILAISQPEIFDEPLVCLGRLWGTPSYKIYEALRAESEYAAWTYLYGFCVNHFTINVNALQHCDTLQEVNDLVKASGYKLNVSGGEIKGSAEELLEQSSTLADMVEVNFIEGRYTVPSCYYEFALRYPQADGTLYQGFIASSANKIFESTDLSLQER